MGRDKAMLPFGKERMLQRVVRLLSEVVPSSTIVVVAAMDQAPPELPADVVVARDAKLERGPPEGLAAGLLRHAKGVDVVYAAACDVPLPKPPFFERMFASPGEREIAVPRDGEHHPPAAVHRTSVPAHVQRLLAADRLRPRFLCDEADTREVAVEELRDADPDLATLENLDYPADYDRALAASGPA